MGYLKKIKMNRNAKIVEQKFPFYDEPNTVVILCSHVINRDEPILFVSHDEDDGIWQFLCGKTHEVEDAKLVFLQSVFELDNSIETLAEMPCGCCATRKNREDEWIIREL